MHKNELRRLPLKLAYFSSFNNLWRRWMGTTLELHSALSGREWAEWQWPAHPRSIWASRGQAACTPRTFSQGVLREGGCSLATPHTYASSLHCPGISISFLTRLRLGYTTVETARCKRCLMVTGRRWRMIQINFLDPAFQESLISITDMNYLVQLLFYFSITVYIQHYFGLVSGVQHSS